MRTYDYDRRATWTEKPAVGEMGGAIFFNLRQRRSSLWRVAWMPPVLQAWRKKCLYINMLVNAMRA